MGSGGNLIFGCLLSSIEKKKVLELSLLLLISLFHHENIASKASQHDAITLVEGRQRKTNNVSLVVQ